FWRMSDEELGSSTRLNALSLAELLQYRQHIDILLHPQGIESSWREDMFSHFLWAYLQWRKRWQRWQASPSGEPPRFCIAAPPDMIAAFLSGLTICLPWQLLTHLTFSTYEDDIRKSQALLVGTCWLPNSQGSLNPTRDLPRECYNPDKGIALNCYRPARIELKPQENRGDHFVDYATRCLKSGNIRQLQILVSNTSGTETIDIDGFLNEYYDFIV